jgi:4-hydroxy-3-polyprenylbenzoate decarboxylase
MTGSALQAEIPGLKEVNAVDAAGVHPLLLAIGSERYTPYSPAQQPAEILTIANHVLGTGQLSLAKFLFITADDTNGLNTQNIKGYFEYVLQRIDLSRDIHFYTNTTIDTLDYSGTSINSGSKVVIAAYGPVLRELATTVPKCLNDLQGFQNPQLVMPGVIALQAPAFINYTEAKVEFTKLDGQLNSNLSSLEGIPFIIICDDANFVSENINNFLWTTFTRSNPSHDIQGIGTFYNNKHWGCNGPLVIDARSKPHHAPPVVVDPATNSKINYLFEEGGSLYGY